MVLRAIRACVVVAAVIEKPLARSAGRKLLDLPGWDAPKASSLRTRIARRLSGTAPRTDSTQEIMGHYISGKGLRQPLALGGVR